MGRSRKPRVLALSHCFGWWNGRISFSSGGGTKYKNTAENLFLNETEVFSKPFLVESELKSREWQLTNETKKIGNYNAQKAIFSEIVERTVISFDNDDNESKVTYRYHQFRGLVYA